MEQVLSRVSIFLMKWVTRYLPEARHSSLSAHCKLVYKCTYAYIAYIAYHNYVSTLKGIPNYINFIVYR